MKKRRSAICIVPASTTANKVEDYFKVHKNLLKDYKLLKIIVVFPIDKPFIFIKAAVAYADTHTKVVPVPIKQPYSGLSDFSESLKTIVATVIKTIPAELLVVTSGGTTKMGHIVKLNGHILKAFGLNVKYLWVAKAPADKKHVITWLPDVEIKYSDMFTVTLKDGKLLVEGKI